ncbi:hypothetical protein Dsin_017331 [Dipteronia sinensis]|uniref:DUF4283 domain-containing protein n=1 Tax=Dipteronia sinensis TaxID=43782 RepID=A0AAE0AET9_9ROSI|nr:hypothetical protein Dsin_017331 [Dipteronia sinensis]
MRAIGRIWKVSEGVEIDSITAKVFTFHFRTEDDRLRVISGSPWSFDDALVAIEKPIGKGTIDLMTFTHANFWVQIHQVPILCMTKKISVFLGGMIGEVLDIDVGNSREAGGKFMLVRVKVDHTTNECLSEEPIPIINGVERPHYRSWMRASPPFNHYKNRGRTGIAYGRGNSSNMATKDGQWSCKGRGAFSDDENVPSTIKQSTPTSIRVCYIEADKTEAFYSKCSGLVVPFMSPALEIGKLKDINLGQVGGQFNKKPKKWIRKVRVHKIGGTGRDSILGIGKKKGTVTIDRDEDHRRKYKTERWVVMANNEKSISKNKKQNQVDP